MKTAKLFRNGRSQALRLPKEFNLPGEDAFIRRLGKALIILPKDDPWASLDSAIEKFPSDCFSDREQPEDQERDSL